MDDCEIFEIFGRNVATFRKLKGLTLEELSERTKINVKFLRRIENATAKRINTNHAFLIADGLNIKPSKLFEE